MVQHTGVLIAFEGLDGAGKTTISQGVANALSNDIPVTLTKQPGGTDIGQKIRTLVIESSMSPETEYLLFAADRAEHMRTLVLPALQRGNVVLVDRMGDSSLAYQGYGHGVDCDMIAHINQWTLCGIIPDMTLYISIPLHTSKQRVDERNMAVSRFEQNHAFLARVKEGFDVLSERADVQVYDGTHDQQDLIAEITQKVEQLWRNKQK